MNDDEITEEIGFDEREELDEDERVVLEVQGVRRVMILLAVVGLEGRDYALLGPEDDEDEAPELLVARYDPDAEGADRFEAIEDARELEAVRAALSDLVEIGA